MCYAITWNSDEPQMAEMLGVDVGGSKILAHVGDGTPLWSHRVRNSRLCVPAVLIETLLALVGDAASSRARHKVAGPRFSGARRWKSWSCSLICDFKWLAGCAARRPA